MKRPDLASELAAFFVDDQHPRHTGMIANLPDGLPLTARGKVDRRRLGELYFRRTP